MGRDTPRPDYHWKDEGLDAKTREEPTLASYLSSLLYLLSVPTLVVASYAGFWLDYYPYGMIIPVFAGLLVGLLVVTFGVMHLTTSGR